MRIIGAREPALDPVDFDHPDKGEKALLITSYADYLDDRQRRRVRQGVKDSEKR